jgi:hypothetical protein
MSRGRMVTHHLETAGLRCQRLSKKRVEQAVAGAVFAREAHLKPVAQSLEFFSLRDDSLLFREGRDWNAYLL